MGRSPWSDLLKPSGRRARAARRLLGSTRRSRNAQRSLARLEENAAYTAELVDTVWKGTSTYERVTVEGQPFVITPAKLAEEEVDSGEELVVYKWPTMVRRYLEIAAAAGEHPRVVELGILHGGSTAFLFQAFQPDVLVAFDLSEFAPPVLERFVDAHGLRDRVHLHYGVDQSDTPTVLRLVEAAAGTAPLDVVVDDASHAYAPTRASFGALFPLLREGGVYVIEDWQWAHVPGDRWQRDGGYLPGEPALTNLITEIVMLQGTRPDLVRETRVRRYMVEVVRGEGRLSAPMDMARLTLNRGKPFEPYL